MPEMYRVSDEWADEHTDHATEEEALKEAQDLIDQYQGDANPEWPEGVEHIVIYKMIYRSTPIPQEVDEATKAEREEAGDDMEYCDFKMVPVVNVVSNQGDTE